MNIRHMDIARLVIDRMWVTLEMVNAPATAA